MGRGVVEVQLPEGSTVASFGFTLIPLGEAIASGRVASAGIQAAQRDTQKHGCTSWSSLQIFSGEHCEAPRRFTKVTWCESGHQTPDRLLDHLQIGHFAGHYEKLSV